MAHGSEVHRERAWLTEVKCIVSERLTEVKGIVSEHGSEVHRERAWLTELKGIVSEHGSSEVHRVGILNT